MSDELLLEARPSHWNFFWHYFFFFLIVPPLVALWRRAGLVFRIYADRILVESGVLSKSHKTIFHGDIRTIDVRRSLLQRIVGTGDVLIAAAGTDDYEDELIGLPAPLEIKELIMKQKRQAEARGD